ncbi:MAG: type I restriction enzyme HsdR N-terminal domain-containing protein [Balneolaceae bacterium]
MPSITKSHYPQIVFRNGNKFLWNPVEKKPFANRPEERVRLRVVEYLIYEAGWSKHRIATESAVTIPASEHPLRTDVVAFTDDLKPHLLVECKAETVQLAEQAALQTARYNTSVNAPFILLTNGNVDYWFEIRSNEAIRQKETPFPAKTKISELRGNLSYWQDRGFCGKKSGTIIRKWLLHTLPLFWDESLPWGRRYLEIKQMYSELHLNHTYRIVNVDTNTKIAISFIGSIHGATYLAAILNHQQQNIGISLTNLDLTAKGEKLNTSLYSAHDTITLNALKHLPLEFHSGNPRLTENLPGFIYRYFEKHLSF